MIVDDSQDELHLMEHIFRGVAPDLAVRTVLGGEPALQQLRTASHPPPVILLDLRMAGMTGIEVLGQIKRDERLRHIQVCAFSNGGVPRDICDCYDAGAACFFQKPTGLAELRSFADCFVRHWFRYASHCERA